MGSTENLNLKENGSWKARKASRVDFSSFFLKYSKATRDRYASCSRRVRDAQTQAQTSKDTSIKYTHTSLPSVSLQASLH